MAQQGFVKTEQQEADGNSEVLQAEYSKFVMSQTIDIEQGAGLKFNKLDENGQMPGARKQQKEREYERRLKDLSSITTEMLIPKYSEGEMNAFCFLYTRSTRSRKLPREWKCLFTYHRLAWNILSRNPKVISLSGWQVQLIAWVFVCWQWKHLITTLIQNWQDLEVLRKWVMVKEIQTGEVEEENSGPSLREIVEHYIDERWPVDKKSNIVQGDNSKRKKEDSSGNVNENVRVNRCSSSEEAEKTSDNITPKNMRTIPSEEDVGKLVKGEREQKRGHFLKIKGLERSKKGKREHKERDNVADGLKVPTRKILQEEEIKAMLKVIIKEVFEEELVTGKQPIDLSTSYEEDDDKGESSLYQGTTSMENQKVIHKARKNGRSKAKNEEKEREEWMKLKETLSRYNVSMDGIQAFQKFRFFCEPGHLPWPLSKQA